MFYPADWRNNANLRRCSWAARGVWIEVMGLMHDTDDYGILRWSLKDIAQALGCPVALVKELSSKGVLKGCDSGQCKPVIYVPRSGRKEGDPVTLVEVQKGPIWFSSRMVKDEYVRSIRGESTRFNDAPKPAPKGGIGADFDASPSQRQGDGYTSSSSVSIKPTTTTNEPRPPEKPSPPSPDSELSTRAEVIATRLRKLEAGRKKRCTINAKDPRVLRWAEAGISDPVLREAYDIAVTEREAAADESPVNAGFLDVFVAKLLNQPGAASAVVVKAWYETAPGIEKKGAELGIPPPEAETGGFPAFKSRVFAAAGLSPGAAAA